MFVEHRWHAVRTGGFQITHAIQGPLDLTIRHEVSIHVRHDT
jgi:hypothetical protein